MSSKHALIRYKRTFTQLGWALIVGIDVLQCERDLSANLRALHTQLRTIT